MKLYCARHGHAELTADASGERQLTVEGCAEVEKIAQYLKLGNVHVSHILHSHKARAKQTASILSQAIAPDLICEATDLLLPEVNVIPLIEQINTWNDDTLLVGHMPFMSLLVSHLVLGHDSEQIVRFTPGTVVCLERYNQCQWIVNWLLHPDLITALQQP